MINCVISQKMLLTFLKVVYEVLDFLGILCSPVRTVMGPKGMLLFLNSLLVCLYSYLATLNCLTFRKQTQFHLLFPVFDGILVHGLNLVADEIEEQMTESALPLIAMAHHVFLQKLWVDHEESGVSLWLHLEYLICKLLVPVEQQGIPGSFILC